MNTKYIMVSMAFITILSCKKEEELPKSDPNKQIILPRVQPIPTGSVMQTSTPQVSQTITPEQMKQMQMQQQAIKQAQNQGVTKPGMNPPHGQPGHQCDIAVGAPLSSKPASKANNSSQPIITKTTINPNNSSTPATTGTATPTILNPDTAANATAPGTNPPHGQPGHQCGIPVGSPLPAK